MRLLKVASAQCTILKNTTRKNPERKEKGKCLTKYENHFFFGNSRDHQEGFYVLKEDILWVFNLANGPSPWALTHGL